MSPIIRASERAADAQGVAFNFEDVFEDLTGRANAYLNQVRGQAAKIVADAKNEAAALHKKTLEEARAQGLAAAQREVDQKIQKQITAQMATVLPALRQAAEQIEQSRLAWLTHWEQSAIHLATAIAARITRREVARQPEILLSLVREALELAAGSPRLRVYLHPDDHAALGREVETLAKELCGIAPLELVPDPAVERGSCRVDTQYGTIDQRFDAQLQRIEEELI